MSDATTALAAAEAAAASASTAGTAAGGAAESVVTALAHRNAASGFADAALDSAANADSSADLAAAAASTAAADALAAVTPANDVAITAVDADAGSAFRVQQDARLSATFARQGDRGAGFIGKCVRQEDAVAAFGGDSTLYKNGSGLYVGTDGYEAPRQFANWLAERFPSAVVNYHSLASWAVYATTVVVSPGLNIAGSDTFDRAAGELVGSNPDVGDAWLGSTGRFALNGSGRAAFVSGSSQVYFPVSPGFQKVTHVSTIPVTYGSAGALWAIAFRASNSAWLGIKITPLGDAIEFGIQWANVYTALHTDTFAAAGIASTGTPSVTYSVELKDDLTVEFKCGTVTYTTSITQAQSDAFEAALYTGMTGGMTGWEIESITAVLPPTNTIDVYNGAFSSKSITDTVAQLATLVPVAPDMMVWAHSHNQATDTPTQYEDKVDAAVEALNTLYPSAKIAHLVPSQNPETIVAAGYATHTARQLDLARFTRVRGYGYPPVFETFLTQGNPAALVITDGVHPTPAGVDVLGQVYIDYFKTLILPPEPGPVGPPGAAGADGIPNPPDVQVFSTPGSATWTKPAGAVSVNIKLIGAGAGGGAGARGPSGTALAGGGGGGSGAMTQTTMRAADLPATVTVGIASGGVGAPGQTADGTAGAAPTNASGNTTFGNYLVAGRGNSPTGGGLGVASTGGSGATGMAAGAAGGVGGATGAAGTAGTSGIATGPGGGGGGITTAPAHNAGGAGGASLAGYLTQATAGAAGGGNGAGGVTTGLGGTGGAGGGANTGGAGGNGGNGAAPGGGGGGGGASLNGSVSGAGGNGGDGICIVTTYF